MTNQSVKPITSAPYKGYSVGAYVCCDIWKLPPKPGAKGKAGKPSWQGVFWSYAEAMANGHGALDKDDKKPHPAARFVTRLFKDDLIATGPMDAPEIQRVRGFSTTNNRLDVADHHNAESGQRFVGINVLGGQNLRRLYVTPDGRVLESKRRRTGRPS